LQQGGWNFYPLAGKNLHRFLGSADMNKIGNHILTAAIPLLCLLLIGAARQAPAVQPAPVKPQRIQFASIQHSPIQPASIAPEPVELLHDVVFTPSVAHVIWMEVTAYCPCTKCCGPNAQGMTASGKDVGYNGGVFVAADTDLFAFGSQFSIPGYHQGQPVEVVDRGSAIKGDHLDVYFPTHEQALQWGRQRLPVTVIQ
jgi:3D (Asp-Asp-Asp) domain-containing protein